MNFVKFLLSQFFFDILFFNILWIVAQNSTKNTIFWKSMMRSFRWIEINCFNRFRFLAEVSTNLQKCSLLANLRTITQEGKRKLGKWPHFFSSAFCALFVIFIFVFENCQNSFSWGLPFLSSVLVCKIPEFWRCKLWDQKFASFDSENINIKESEKRGFTFSIKMRTKFVWSPGLLLLVPECYFA